jgi:hypothetical protein
MKSNKTAVGKADELQPPNLPGIRIGNLYFDHTPGNRPWITRSWPSTVERSSTLFNIERWFNQKDYETCFSKILDVMLAGKRCAAWKKAQPEYIFHESGCGCLSPTVYSIRHIRAYLALLRDDVLHFSVNLRIWNSGDIYVDIIPASWQNRKDLPSEITISPKLSFHLMRDPKEEIIHMLPRCIERYGPDSPQIVPYLWTSTWRPDWICVCD